MALITVRVDEELKKRMSRFKDINWSEIVRKAILDVLKREEERNLAIALLLNEKNVITPDEGFSSVEVIRKWREEH
ncbi:MAG: hypothetical protein QXQ24_01145 [Nitrososphaeria archaeon]